MTTLLFGIKNMIWWPFCFQNKDTITLGQAFLSIYILCKSDEASCNILGYRKKILEQTLRPENFRSFAMATVATGCPTKPNQLLILLGKPTLKI